MAKDIKPSAAACSPALITKLVTLSDSDQSVVFKSIQNMDTSPATIKLRNAANDTDVVIDFPAWGRMDGYYSRVWSTGTTVVNANKIVGFYDTP